MIMSELDFKVNKYKKGKKITRMLVLIALLKMQY